MPNKLASSCIKAKHIKHKLTELQALKDELAITAGNSTYLTHKLTLSSYRQMSKFTKLVKYGRFEQQNQGQVFDTELHTQQLENRFFSQTHSSRFIKTDHANQFQRRTIK